MGRDQRPRVFMACLAVVLAGQSWAGASGAEVDAAPPETIRLTLAEAVARALRDNPALVDARLDRTLHRFDLEQSEESFLPKVSLEAATAGYRTDRGADTGGYTFGAGPRVTMRLPTGGAVSVRPAWTARLGHSGGPDEAHDTSVELAFSHPLLRGAGLDVGLAPVRLARIEEERHVLDLRAAAMDVITSVIKAYRAAIRADLQLKINESALQRARETLEVNQLLVDTGRMARTDIVQTETDIARRELEVVRSRNRVADAGLDLNVLLDLEGDVRVLPVQTLTVEPLRPDLESIRALARERNADYLKAHLNLRSAAIRLAQAADGTLWELSFEARAAFGGQGTSFGAGLRDLGGNADKGIYTAGVALTIPLGDAATQAAKRAHIAARLDLRKAERSLATEARELDAGLRNAVSAVELGLTQMELARQALDLARQQLEIEDGKLKLGLTSNFRLATFQTDLVNAQVNELDARIGYLNAWSTLDRTAGTVLDTWEVEVEGALE